MPEPVLRPGDELDTPEAFVVNGYAAYAASASHSVDELATPIVLLDLDGYLQSDLPLPVGTSSTRKVRLIFEQRGATETVQGMINALEQLENLRRNQERP